MDRTAAPTPNDFPVSVRVVPGASVTAPEASSSAGIPVMVEMTPPDGTDRTPSDICCVVDVSGSMGTDALIKNESGETRGHGLSVLDIVKHSLKTVIRNLKEHDRLALVSYSNEATLIFGLTDMTDNNKTEKELELSRLQPAGMTNLWDGLKKGMEALKEGGSTGGRLQHIMLFTDGLPNVNPPRGILPMLKRVKASCGNRLPCTINTFGFGYELDSALLSQIAAEGSGSFAFIPDSGFVGTVFVNALTNLIVMMGRETDVVLEPQNGAAFAQNAPILGGYAHSEAGGKVVVNVGPIQYGQKRHVIAQLVLPSGADPSQCYLKATVDYSTCASDRSTRTAEWDSKLDETAVEPERLRLLFVDCMRSAMDALKQTNADKAAGHELPMDKAREFVEVFKQTLANSPVKDAKPVVAIMEDLSGQVTEAFSRADWYNKWGVHYLPSLMSAHMCQQCNNFKDASVQDYGGKLFETCRDVADNIFLNLPPPAPSASPARRPDQPTIAHSTSGLSATPSAPAAAAPAALTNMSAYYDRYTTCVAGDSPVKLACGSERLASDVRRGDVLAAADGDAVGEVLCAVRTRSRDGKLALATLGDLRVTPYHPILVEGEWRFPAELTDVRDEACDVVCNFLLKEGGRSMVVGGVPCVTLGHGLQDGAAAHPFFASWAAVHADLKQCPGFDVGLVELGLGSILRDPTTGMVCGLRPAQR